MVLILKLFGLFVTLHPAVPMVVTILAAAPAASSATMFAEKFNCDACYVSRLVTISTLLSILTMPIILLLV
jgi:predicted permease